MLSDSQLVSVREVAQQTSTPSETRARTMASSGEVEEIQRGRIGAWSHLPVREERGAMAGSCPPTPDLSDEFDEHDAGFDEVDPSI
jgi:hypothetical protein